MFIQRDRCEIALILRWYLVNSTIVKEKAFCLKHELLYQLVCQLLCTNWHVPKAAQFKQLVPWPAYALLDLSGQLLSTWTRNSEAVNSGRFT